MESPSSCKMRELPSQCRFLPIIAVGPLLPQATIREADDPFPDRSLFQRQSCWRCAGAFAQQQTAPKPAAPAAAAPEARRARPHQSLPLRRRSRPPPIRPRAPHCSANSATGAPTPRPPAARKSVSRSASRTRPPPTRPAVRAIPAFLFVSTRPSEKVKEEVSVIIGYPFKAGSEAAVAGRRDEFRALHPE